MKEEFEYIPTISEMDKDANLKSYKRLSKYMAIQVARGNRVLGFLKTDGSFEASRTPTPPHIVFKEDYAKDMGWLQKNYLNRPKINDEINKAVNGYIQEKYEGDFIQPADLFEWVHNGNTVGSYETFDVDRVSEALDHITGEAPGFWKLLFVKQSVYDSLKKKQEEEREKELSNPYNPPMSHPMLVIPAKPTTKLNDFTEIEVEFVIRLSGSRHVWIEENGMSFESEDEDGENKISTFSQEEMDAIMSCQAILRGVFPKLRGELVILEEK